MDTAIVCLWGPTDPTGEVVVEALEQGMDPQPLEMLEGVAEADPIRQLLVGRAVGLFGAPGLCKSTPGGTGYGRLWSCVLLMVLRQQWGEAR